MTHEAKLTIHELTDNTYLHAHYGGQIEPQDCYLELDCDDGTLTADYNGEIGNAVPVSVWHNRTIRWGIPALKAHRANELMHDLAPLCERILAGYESEWDGSNHVGRYTEDAEDAIDEVTRKVESYPLHDSDWALVVYRADEWLHPDGLPRIYTDARREAIAELGITAQTTDDELEALGERLTAEADHDGDVDVLTGMDEYLEELRDEMIAFAEEEGN